MFDLYYSDVERNIAYQRIHPKQNNIDFHLHEGFEIYFLVSGDVNYFVEKSVYSLQYGDLIITNNHEIHKPTFKSDRFYERITINFNPLIIYPINPHNFDLLSCFTNRINGECNKVTLKDYHLLELRNIFLKFENINNEFINYHALLKYNYLIELLVLINKAFAGKETINENLNIPENLGSILNYIDEHLEDNLSLETLERLFFINKFYLCKLFKKFIGSSIHKYIIHKRVAKAKKLISAGLSLTDTCLSCGFNDYSNFSKTFNRIVGISPSKYKSSISDAFPS